MKKMKYQTKFLLYHTLLMMGILIGCVSYFHSVIVSEISRQDEQDFRVITEKTGGQVDQLFYEMDRTALQIAANPSIVNDFRSIPVRENSVKENYFSDDISRNSRVTKLLESYNFKSGGHQRICLYNDFGDFAYTSNLPVTDGGIEMYFSSECFEKTKQYFNIPDHFVYFASEDKDVLSGYMEEDNRYFFLVRQIKDYFSSSTPCGYVQIQENGEKFDSLIDSLGTGVSAALLDESGNVVCKSQNMKEADLRGFGDNKDGTREVSLTYAPYRLYFVRKPVELNRAIKNFYFIMAVVVAALIIVGVLLERILVRHLTRPLIRLTRSLHDVSMKNLHIDIEADNAIDVVQDLEESFNIMLKKLDESMQERIAAKTNEIRAHFFALQSQMNPHFLHNMLAIISMEAQMGEAESIPDICDKLGAILRYTSQMGDGMSTIGEECSIARNYLSLMKVRYEDMFQYSIDVGQEARTVKIPKLILQPICENCFQHGFKNKEPVWQIQITVSVEEERWTMTVSDNGTGFSDEMLREFERKKEEVEVLAINDILKELSIGGLCLVNIYTRLKLSYAEDMIFQMENTETGAMIRMGGKTDV